MTEKEHVEKLIERKIMTEKQIKLTEELQSAIALEYHPRADSYHISKMADVLAKKADGWALIGVFKDFPEAQDQLDFLRAVAEYRLTEDCALSALNRRC